MTEAEVILWSQLRRKQLGGFFFRRQHPVKPFVTDFACVAAKLIVEVDGSTHGEDYQRSYDAHRTAYLEQRGWTVIRFWNDDIYKSLDEVLNTILRHLQK